MRGQGGHLVFPIRPKKHILGRGRWDLASCQVSLNSVQWFQKRSRKCEKLKPDGRTDDGRWDLASCQVCWIPFGSGALIISLLPGETDASWCIKIWFKQDVFVKNGRPLQQQSQNLAKSLSPTFWPRHCLSDRLLNKVADRLCVQTINKCLETVPTSVYSPRVEQTPFAGRSSARLHIKVADRLCVQTINNCLETVPTSVYSPRVEQTPFAGRSSARLHIKVADRLCVQTINNCLETVPTSVYSPRVEQTPFAGRSSVWTIV